MEKKNIIISSIVTWLVVIGGTYFSMANDDYTCYNYTTSNSCAINGKTFADASAMAWVSCTPWSNQISDCSGNYKTTTYTRWTAYSCSNYAAEKRASYSVSGVCTVRFTDTQAPTVDSWGID